MQRLSSLGSQTWLPVSDPFDSQAMVAQSVPCQVFSFVWHQTLWIGSLPQCILYLGPHSMEVCFVFLLFQSNMSGSFLFLCSQFGLAKLLCKGGTDLMLVDSHISLTLSLPMEIPLWPAQYAFLGKLCSCIWHGALQCSQQL